jgi:hypothetical protein
LIQVANGDADKEKLLSDAQVCDFDHVAYAGAHVRAPHRIQNQQKGVEQERLTALSQKVKPPRYFLPYVLM